MHAGTPTRKATLSAYHVGQQIFARLWRRPTWQTMTSISQEHLGRLCGVSSRTVRTALQWWESQGAIMRRVAQPLATGGRRPDLLFVHRKRLAAVLRLIRATWLRTSVSVYSASEGKINRLRAVARRGENDMQGKLFQRKPVERPRKSIDPNSPKGRLATWRRLYAQITRKEAVITSIPQAMGTIARLSGALPTVHHWQAACEAYLRQSDRAVVLAGHPLHWLPRRLPALMSTVNNELVRLEAIARDYTQACEAFARDITRLGGTVTEDMRGDLQALRAAYATVEALARAAGPTERELAAERAREANRAALRAQWEAIRGGAR